MPDSLVGAGILPGSLGGAVRRARVRAGPVCPPLGVVRASRPYVDLELRPETLDFEPKNHAATSL